MDGALPSYAAQRRNIQSKEVLQESLTCVKGYLLDE